MALKDDLVAMSVDSAINSREFWNLKGLFYRCELEIQCVKWVYSQKPGLFKKGVVNPELVQFQLPDFDETVERKRFEEAFAKRGVKVAGWEDDADKLGKWAVVLIEP